MYYVSVNAYTISITSYRTISDLFQQKNSIDISNDMLSDFTFFNRKLTFNITLMMKIKTQSGKLLIKRFNMSFVSKKEQDRMTDVLNKILAINKNEGK